MIEAVLTKAFLAKVATVVAGLSLATTGAGAADVLPQVAQDRVAAAVEKASPLDLPDIQDPASGAEKGDKPEKADNPEKAGEAEEAEKTPEAEKPEKDEKAKDNFGTIVSDRAHSTDDKGREFGQSVSAEARARTAARRQGAKPSHEADEDPDGSDDDDAEEGEHGSPAAKSRRSSDKPAAQANQGSGHRP